MQKQKIIYFHVGLGKTGSTYLQNRFFTRLTGIHYIHTSKYKKSVALIQGSMESKFLVSREFDQQLGEECSQFSQQFPEARIIVFLRQHDTWIASQYRRFVKNGFSGSFNEFMDIRGDRGLWKKADLDFFSKIKTIEYYFKSRPLVLFYEDFKRNPTLIFDQLCAFMGAGYDLDGINLNPKHVSYSEKQLKVIRGVGKYFFQPYPPPIANPVLRYLRRLWHQLFRYSILYGAKLIPNFLINPAPLISVEELGAVRAFGAADWEKCKVYARETVPGSLLP
jgi:hypothetical protein